jgi:hypothetical protein
VESPSTARAIDLNALEAGDAEAAEREREMLADLAAQGIYPETTPARVMIKYYNTGQTIGLYNESYIGQSEYYSTKRANADYKVIRDIDMGALLKQLDDFGYFDEAAPGIVRAGGSSLTLLVQRGVDAWTVHLPRYVGRADDETAQAAHKDKMEFAYKCADAVRAIYNTTRALQLINNEQGAKFFENEAQRISDENTGTRAGKRP